MASLTYNEGANQLETNGSVSWSADTIEVILVKSSYTPNKDDTNSVYAAAEISGVSGYTGGFGGAGRKVLGSKTKTKDTANDRIVYDAADPSTWTTLGAGDTIGGAIIGKKGSADDTTAVPLFFLDFADTPTNGGNFTLQFDANGIGYTQQ